MSNLDSLPPSRPNFYDKLQGQWNQLNFLCVGLDSDYIKIPHSPYKQAPTDAGDAEISDTIFTFNKDIIEVTHDLVGMWKPNLAFYEKQGEAGRKALRATIKYIRENHPDIVIILDAKRGDIANTNEGYVTSDFDEYDADAVTVHSYLGPEAMDPFLKRKDKGTIVLVKTSNPGSGRYQNQKLWGKNRMLYEEIAHDVRDRWNVNQNCGVVVGATYPRELAKVRKIIGRMPILIPGVGTQGGDLAASVAAGRDDQDQGMIINSSSGVTFPKLKDGQNFKDAVRESALNTRNGIHAALERPVMIQVGVDLKKHPEGLTEAQESLLADIFDKKMFKLDLEKGFKLRWHKDHPDHPNAPLSPLYIDLRKLRKHPETKLKAVQVFAEMLEDSGVTCELLADVPTAATPFISSLSDLLGLPMITPRGDKKGYGSGDSIDGFEAETDTGKTAVLFDDLATDGGSKIAPAHVLRNAGIKVENVLILLDREQGATEQLAEEGLTLHSAFKLEKMIRFYTRTGRITEAELALYKEKMTALTAYIANVKKHPEGFTDEEEQFLLERFTGEIRELSQLAFDNPKDSLVHNKYTDLLVNLEGISPELKQKLLSLSDMSQAIVDFYKRKGKF